MVCGVGIDIIEIPRLARAVDRHGERFLQRVYTEAEDAYCRGRSARAACLAVRFAAKEAVMKALGVGWGQALWREIEVRRAASGRPDVVLSGRTRGLARAKGITAFHVSLSHGRDTAVACVVAISGGTGGGVEAH